MKTLINAWLIFNLAFLAFMIFRGYILKPYLRRKELKKLKKQFENLKN